MADLSKQLGLLKSSIMKWIFKILLLTLIHVNIFAQTPEKMSYQAVIRDNSDVLLKNSKVDLKIVLRQGSPQGSSVYEETHRVQTNPNGLVSFQIGTGATEKGSFHKINWSKGPYFIESLIDPEGRSNYTIKAVSQMLSVPYAFHAKTADSFTGTISHSQMPDYYTADEVDNILGNITTLEGDTQSLKLKKNLLEISGGNTVSFENWDTNVTDDFSGVYEDLQNKPELYNKTEIDGLIGGIITTGGVSQNLNLDQSTLSISGGNSISFGNWDTNASDDFSGIYDDLQNKPELFSGEYNALKNLPSLYTSKEVDKLINGIETTGGVSQNLNLDQSTLSISGGNSISFENWDTNASDDFSGIYDDLQNKPELFSGEYNALKNLPSLYTSEEVDNLINGIETTGGVSQNLNLDQNTLSISGGNSISFGNWDTNASDDFSGDYFELQNIPEQYSKNEIDYLISNVETTGGQPQLLTLEGQKLLISNGNSIAFENWDNNATDDFDGEYSSLKNAPLVYTQKQVDSIKSALLTSVANDYVKKPEIRAFANSRNIASEDVGNTLVCSSSATLTITSNFNNMKIGETVNIEILGTQLTVKGASGVIINGTSAASANVGNNSVYTGGILRKIDSNNYIIL